MNTQKPASETLDCAGIRHMEFGQPSALRMRTCEGKEAQVIAYAKREHPSRNAPVEGSLIDPNRWGKS